MTFKHRFQKNTRDSKLFVHAKAAMEKTISKLTVSAGAPAYLEYADIHDKDEEQCFHLGFLRADIANAQFAFLVNPDSSGFTATQLFRRKHSVSWSRTPFVVS